MRDLSDGDLRPQLQLVAAVAAADDGHGGGGAAVVGHRVHGVHPGAGLVARRLQGLRDGWTGSLGITQPRTHRIGYLGVEQDLRERREHVGSREQLGEVEVEPSSEWVQSSLIQYTWRGLYDTGYREQCLILGHCTYVVSPFV